ncbi:MAG: carbamoyl-phosphate synthase domain-containing protein, partial [Clostridia bacterium]
MDMMLVLEDGSVFRGKGFGHVREAVGEIVFNTGMTGYQETMTDSSYYGQIVLMTYPLIGNYGINESDYESRSIKVAGLVAREFCKIPSNFRSETTLDEYMSSLELTETIRDHTLKGSLLWVLDQTLTPMGGRLLRRWISQPLLDKPALEQRLKAVEVCHNNLARRMELRDQLRGFGDLERLCNRIIQGIAGPRDLVSLGSALERTAALAEIVHTLTAESQISGTEESYPLNDEALDPCQEVSALIGQAIVEEPPALLSGGRVIRQGYSKERDGIEASAADARGWVANLERAERERTGIKSLKVGFNKVFGYYLEVTKANIQAVPEEYIRKQTLVNAERYITPELKERETLILNAEERAQELEAELFANLVAQLGTMSDRMLQTARAVAHLDVYLALAHVAAEYGYVRPELSTNRRIAIEAGRHPVVERTLAAGAFVPNDVTLGADDAIHIITGPNMSGKST